MERVSQLILRNAQRLGGGHVLLINPPRDSCFSSLAEMGSKPRIFTQDFGDFKWLQTSGAEVEFGTIPVIESYFDHIVFIQPRERERLIMMLHALSSGMSAGTKLWLAGENRSGIKSCAKRLSLYFETVAKTDSARHCALLAASKPRACDPFDLSAYAKSWPVASGTGDISITSLPGTFAHGSLDRGSELLLNTLKKLEPSGRVLDFACGNGVLGLTLLSLDSSIDLTLLDTSALALESARLSLRGNEKEATLLASDGLSEINGQFDWIISNPPFHKGIKNELNIAHDFFREAGHYLTKKGRILLVCNHHLPYPGWLEKYFTRVEIVRSDRNYKVILASGKRR
jgi:16S rRNA (guanine1207-N2)-methyltransferase